MRTIFVSIALLLTGMSVADAAYCGPFSFTPRDVCDDQACRSMGAQPGTEVYVQCRLAQQQMRMQRGALIMKNYWDMQRSFQANRPLNCSTTYFGSTAQTHCY